jgi:hypothetical protein
MSVDRVKDGLHELIAMKIIDRHYTQGRQTTYTLPDFDYENSPLAPGESAPSTPGESTPSTPGESTPSEGANLPGVGGRIYPESLIEVSEQTNEQTNEQTARAREDIENARRHPDPYFEQAVPILEALVGRALSAGERGMVGRWRKMYPHAETFLLDTYRDIASSKEQVNDLIPFMGRVLKSRWEERQKALPAHAKYMPPRAW